MSTRADRLRRDVPPANGVRPFRPIAGSTITSPDPKVIHRGRPVRRDVPAVREQYSVDSAIDAGRIKEFSRPNLVGPSGRAFAPSGLRLDVSGETREGVRLTDGVALLRDAPRTEFSMTPHTLESMSSVGIENLIHAFRQSQIDVANARPLSTCPVPVSANLGLRAHGSLAQWYSSLPQGSVVDVAGEWGGTQAQPRSSSYQAGCIMLWRDALATLRGAILWADMAIPDGTIPFGRPDLDISPRVAMQTLRDRRLLAWTTEARQVLKDSEQILLNCMFDG